MSEDEFVEEISIYPNRFGCDPSEATLREWWQFAYRRRFLVAREASSDEMRLTKAGRRGLAAAESLFNFDDLRRQTRSVALYVAPTGAAAAGAFAAIARNRTALYVAGAVAGMFVLLLILIWIETKAADWLLSRWRPRQIRKAVQWLDGEAMRRLPEHTDPTRLPTK